MDKEIECKYANNKEYFISKIDNLDDDQKCIIREQIDLFYSIHGTDKCANKYVVGDKVELNSNTLIHGVRDGENVIDRLKSIKNYGIISRTFISDITDWKVNYCVSAWHVKKPTLLGDYIRLYSGMTVRTSFTENDMVPYGQFDNYVASLKDKENRYIFAELSKENTFLPSLSSNSEDKQIALILFSGDEVFKNIMNNNLLSDNVSDLLLKKFFCVKDYDRLIEQRDINEYGRTAYVPFGIPSAFVEGILVGRKVEYNKKILSEIKDIFPNSYIVNLDGVVIL